MRSLRLALAQLNPTVGDLDGNFRRVAADIERARAQGVEVLAFPEMVIPGYMPEDLLLKPSFIERSMWVWILSSSISSWAMSISRDANGWLRRHSM